MTELAHRASNGLDVALLWSRQTGRLVVAVADVRTGESFTVDAPRDRALDVYNHPFRVPDAARRLGRHRDSGSADEAPGFAPGASFASRCRDPSGGRKQRFGFPHHETPGSPIPLRAAWCESRCMLLASSLFRPHRAAVEVAILASLYGIYEAVRGAGDASLSVARDHTSDIVALERGLHVFNERAVQEWSRASLTSRRCSAWPT
jgi:hypothetical protein